MKFIRKTIMYLMHIGSWALALYLFAIGNVAGGMGTLAVAFVMGLVYLIYFVICLVVMASEYADERKRVAREAAEKEHARQTLRSA